MNVYATVSAIRFTSLVIGILCTSICNLTQLLRISISKNELVALSIFGLLATCWGLQNTKIENKKPQGKTDTERKPGNRYPEDWTYPHRRLIKKKAENQKKERRPAVVEG